MKFNFNGIQVSDGANYYSYNGVRTVSNLGNYYNFRAYTLCPEIQSDVRMFDLTFDKYGNLSSVKAFSFDSGAQQYYNYAYDSGEYFHFELESLDEENHTVKGSFSGRLYANRFDLNSEYVEVSGSFYNEINSDFGTSEFSMFGNLPNVSAKINGTDWHATRNLDEFRFLEGYVDEPEQRKYISDDRYKLAFRFTFVQSLGDYQFTDTTGAEYIKLGVYNPVTGLFDYYNLTSGEFNIVENMQTSDISFRQSGTFNLTAVNPNNSADVIHITDGVFVFNSYSY